MKDETKLKMLDVMLDTVEACVLLHDLDDEQARDKVTTEILALMVTMTNEMKDVLLFAFMTHMSALLLAIGDLRGETRDEVVAHWRFATMHSEHNRVVSDADPV